MTTSTSMSTGLFREVAEGTGEEIPVTSTATGSGASGIVQA